MNRALVLGDVHANKQFLEYAFYMAKKNNCHSIIQVGDFGYGFGLGIIEL